jgi:hypothetical protein
MICCARQIIKLTNNATTLIVSSVLISQDLVDLSFIGQHSGTNNIIGLKYCTVLCNNDVTSFEILVCDRMKFPIMHYMLKQEIVSHKIISHLIVLQTYAAEGRFTFTSHSKHIVFVNNKYFIAVNNLLTI